MKRKLSMLAALILSLGVFTACGSNQEADQGADAPSQEVEESQTEGEDKEEVSEEPSEEEDQANEAEAIEVVFWHAMGGGQGEALEKLTQQFEEENPNITINLQNKGGYGDLNQALVASMQSPKDLPIITQAYPDWMLQFDNAGMVADLTDFVKGEDGIEDYEDIFPGIREEIEQDGRIIGIPFNKSTEVFWYNKDLFEELGLEVPTSYEELKEVSQKIYEEKGIPGVGFDSLSNYYVTYLKNKGVEFDGSLDITSPESVEAVNYYNDGVKEGYFRIAGTDQYMSGPFANEQAGAYIGSNAGEVYIKEGVEDKFTYAAAPYPAENAFQQGTNIYMFDKASDEEKAAAFKYLKFLQSKDAQIQFALDTGYMPARKSSVEDEAYQSSDSSIAPILSEASEKLFSRPLVEGSQQAYNDIGSLLESILSNKDADVKAELEAFAPQFESDFAQ
ncbi:MAG: ABC transporter substrate-binding protein [Anaerococcus sp.]|nr:ABC transporter substrate-binding protein [Anaerococcus sp.]